MNRSLLSSQAGAVSAALLLLSLAGGLYGWWVLPAEPIAVHFDMAGKPDGWMTPALGLLLGPGIGAVIWLLCLLLPIPPATALAVSLPIAGAEMLILGLALGQSWNVTRVLTLLLGLTWIIMGNSLGKLPRNDWAGIRTPWAKDDEEVWAGTQRFGGWAFITAGLATLAMAADPGIRLGQLMAPVAVAAGLSVLRSWQLWRRRHPGQRASHKVGAMTLVVLGLALVPLLAVLAHKLGYLPSRWMVRLALGGAIAIIIATAIRKAEQAD